MHDMKTIRTWSIVPVDLNAFMCINARILGALSEITGFLVLFTSEVNLQHFSNRNLL